MKKNSVFILFALFAVIIFSLSAFVVFEPKPEKIKWVTFQQAMELRKQQKKKIFIDVYTDWCGWCKRMDATTFENPVVVKYMNDNFYAVKMNAEMKDTIVFDNYTFVNPSPKAPRSTHQLAASLLNNQLSYPTSVYLDEDFKMLTPIPGYQSAAQIEMILKYFGSNDFKTISWIDYQKTFKGEVVENNAPMMTSPH